jgi:hypothetical protein
MSAESQRLPSSHHTLLGAQYARNLAGALTAFGRAHQLQSALTWALRLLALGLAIDAAALLARRFAPFDPPLPLLLLPPALGLVAGAALAAARRPRPLWLAQQIDARLGLRERTLTALELVGGGADAPLAREQLDDAVHHLRRAEPLEAFPLRLPRREAAASLLLLLALVPLLLLGPRERAVQGATAERLALGEAERIQTVADEIERDEPADQAETNAQVAEMLRQTAEALRQNAADPDRAVAQLGDAERRLAQLQRAQAADTAAALARLADALDRDQRTRPVASALDRSDYQRAAAELRQLGARAASGTQADRQALSDALRRAAAATARYDDRLAEGLRQAADRAASGDAAATDAAAQELDRAGGEMRHQETLERALSQLQSSRQTVAAGASQQRDSARAGGRSSTGDRRDASDAQAGDGQGSDAAGGQPGGGSARQQGGQNEGEGNGGGGAGTGGGAGRAQVYDPAATRLRQVQVPGGDFDRPQVTEGDQPSEGADGEVTVDFRDVLPTYQERATRAMQDRYVPLGMKDLVRDYFSSLGGR